MFHKMQTKNIESLVLGFIYTLFIVLNVPRTVNGNFPRPRGVSISRSVLYQPKTPKIWACLDGSRLIHPKQVNDDYCDCDDGSDEPGTSACPNGIFHCDNAGYKEINIPSSRVDDGICDCCDGSDELKKVGCPNTCLELGNVEAENRRNEEELHKQGMQKREEMIAHGKQLRAERDKRYLELNQRIKEQENLKAEKEEIKRSFEALEAEALAAFQAQQQLDVQTTKAEEESQQIRQEATESFTKYDVNNDGFVEIAEVMIDMALDRDRSGIVDTEEAKYFLDERERVDLDAFVTLAWPRIKPLKMLDQGIFKPPQKEENQNEADDIEHVEEKQKQSFSDDPENGALANDEEEAEEEQYEEEEEEPNSGVGVATPEGETPPTYDPETERIVQEANAARSSYAEVERTISEIQHEVTEIEQQNAKDYGPQEEYAIMDGECYTHEDREYIYTLCPFDRASQRQRNGGADTTLGRWDQWVGEGAYKYSQQKYSNGAACWNGPQRSVIVNMRCALKPKILSVTEPNRCEYYFEFETPAACDVKAFATSTRHIHEEL